MFQYKSDNNHLAATDLENHGGRYVFSVETSFSGALEFFTEHPAVRGVSVGFSFAHMLTGEPPLIIIELIPGLDQKHAEEAYIEICTLLYDALLTEDLLESVNDNIFDALDEPCDEQSPAWWLRDNWLSL